MDAKVKNAAKLLDEEMSKNPGLSLRMSVTATEVRVHGSIRNSGRYVDYNRAATWEDVENARIDVLAENVRLVAHKLTDHRFVGDLKTR